MPHTTALHPRIVLAIAAHPDDIDFTAGGTIATFVQQGAAVYYLVLTDGGKGSHDHAMTADQLRDIRQREQRSACSKLGVTDVFFCDYPDGILENTIDVKRDVVRAIRHIKPDVVITLDPSVLYVAARGMINHPDHRAAGQAVLDAVYPLARDHMAFPELLQEHLEPHNTRTVLLATLAAEGNYMVDITDVLPHKLQALLSHNSQFPDAGATKAKVTAWAAETGVLCGHDYAEPFIRIDIDA